MLNKKLSKFFLVSAACLMMASCGEIVARPSVIEGDGNEILDKIELKDSDMNNLLETIYNAMHSSSALSTTTINILNEKLYVNYFGDYSELKAAYDSLSGDKVAANELVNKHKGYQELDEKGNRVSGKEELELARVKRTYERIQKLISDKLYTALSSSDYQDINGLFSEKLFALGVYKKLYSLDPSGSKTTWKEFNDTYDFYEKSVLLLPYTHLYNEEENKWDDKGGKEEGIIHIQPITIGEKTYEFGYYNDYVMHEILPTIYQHILSEYYLYTNEYSSLGSKYARKAKYISIAQNSKGIYKTKHSDLVTCFATENINATTGEKANLETLQDAWIGFNLKDAETTTLLDHAGFNKVTVKVTPAELPALTDGTDKTFIEKYDAILGTEGVDRTLTYYEGTLFGNIVEDFREINPNSLTESSKTQENKFSGNNKYSYYDGFVKEVNTLLQKKLIVKGWGLKSDGFTGLDTSIKDRLMSINVATDLDKNADSTYKSNYLHKNAAGSFYLLPEKKMPNDTTPFVLSSSTTKYIVEVEEAASVAKLSKTSENKAYTEVEREDIAYEICNLLADNSTVKSNAIEFFLEESELLYHDDEILKYFKENYPNLFEK